MAATHLIGLDFGSESVRGVLVDADSGAVRAARSCNYRHGILTAALPGGAPLPPFFVLQVPDDFLEAAAVVLTAIGAGRDVSGIGLGFTASTPLPARADGVPLSRLHPGEPHSYAKLWKHAAAQGAADRITAAGGDFLRDVGGRLSANSLIAKAAELADTAPAVWAETARFIEAADWVVWQLTGTETRSAALATYKAAFRPGVGYPPDGVVPGLAERVALPQPIGTAAGMLSPIWRERTGILGAAVVAVPVIDAHMVVPAATAPQAGTLVGALGTSAAWMMLDQPGRPLPPGLEGTATGGVVPGLSCHEAGQAGFGDTLGWFVRTFPRGSLADSFRSYDMEAAALDPGAGGLMALDWWSGNRVPHADVTLSGCIMGLTQASTAAGLYRALMEAVCFGARTILDRIQASGTTVERVVATSGLSLANPALVQILADVLGRAVRVPQREQLTAIGGTIHAAVAAGVVRDYVEGAARLAAAPSIVYEPRLTHQSVYDELYVTYRAASDDRATRERLHALAAFR